MSDLIVQTFPVGMLGCNCTILADPKSREAIVIDPGGDHDAILARLKKEGLVLKAMLHTHAHVDHIGGTRAVHEATRAKILFHEKDRWLYDNIRMQAEWIGMAVADPAKPDAYLAEGDEIRFGSGLLRTIHTPGHTPGSLCFHWPASDLVFSGDTLFAGSIGRTDLWGGSMPQILESIEKKLLAPFEDATRVIPGHGSATTIGQERRTNPFVGKKS